MLCAPDQHHLPFGIQIMVTMPHSSSAPKPYPAPTLLRQTNLLSPIAAPQINRCTTADPHQHPSPLQRCVGRPTCQKTGRIAFPHTKKPRPVHPCFPNGHVSQRHIQPACVQLKPLGGTSCCLLCALWYLLRLLNPRLDCRSIPSLCISAQCMLV